MFSLIYCFLRLIEIGAFLFRVKAKSEDKKKNAVHAHLFQQEFKGFVPKGDPNEFSFPIRFENKMKRDINEMRELVLNA